MITIYTIQDCPNCENIKSKLTAAGYEFREEDMSTPESITELRTNGCFAMEAPVLRVDDTFYDYCACSQPGSFGDIVFILVIGILKKDEG